MKFPTTIPCSEIVWDNILRGNHRWGRRQISLMKIRIDLLQSFNLLPSFWVSINLMTRNLLKRKTIHPDLNLALGLKRASANLVCINLKQKENPKDANNKNRYKQLHSTVWRCTQNLKTIQTIIRCFNVKRWLRNLVS